jgi:hypothetical protein
VTLLPTVVEVGVTVTLVVVAYGLTVSVVVPLEPAKFPAAG